jgi:hypothetical protein
MSEASVPNMQYTEASKIEAVRRLGFLWQL